MATCILLLVARRFKVPVGVHGWECGATARSD